MKPFAAMDRNLALVVVFFVLIILSRGSAASFPDKIWNLHFRFALLKDSDKSIAPSPGPSAISTGKFSGDTTKKSPPEIPPLSRSSDGSTAERCSSSSKTCRDLMSMTACLLFADHAVEQYLLIQNDGDISLKVNVTIFGAKYKEIQIPEHRAKKVNISDDRGTPLITLDAGNGKCMIHIGSLTNNGDIFKQLSSHLTHINLVSGSYLLFSIALVIGGVWACCKMGSKGRQADGVPYQELELVANDSPPTNDLEAAEGWDQGWDDDWDELKTVNNSNTSDRDGWGNDWND